MHSLRRIRSFVAVFEEGSFTAAAEREGATQSGVSQHVKQLEDFLATPLFQRDGRAVTPTAAGRRYYEECVAVLRRLDAASRDVRAAGTFSDPVRVGLMPTFTRALLSPTLERYLDAAPTAEIRVTEAYSAVLTEMVLKGDLDFAVVPGAAPVVGLSATLLVRDRELLVAARGRTGDHLAPARLSGMGPLKFVLPSLQNARRRNLETYFSVNDVHVERRLELDAMMGTLRFVEATDWVAVLPSVMMFNELDGERFDIRPLAEPALFADFVLIEPARRAMTPAAKLFSDLLAEEAVRATEFRRARIGRDPAA